MKKLTNGRSFTTSMFLFFIDATQTKLNRWFSLKRMSVYNAGEGRGGIRHLGSLFLHRGRSRGEKHFSPLPGSDGESRDTPAL